MEESACDTKVLFMHMQWLEDAIRPEHKKLGLWGLAPKQFEGQNPWVSSKGTLMDQVKNSNL